MRSPFFPAVAALTLTALPLSAQLRKGTEPPTFEFDSALNDAPASFDGFRGRLVLIEFFATW